MSPRTNDMCQMDSNVFDAEMGSCWCLRFDMLECHVSLGYISKIIVQHVSSSTLMKYRSTTVIIPCHIVSIYINEEEGLFKLYEKNGPDDKV